MARPSCLAPMSAVLLAGCVASSPRPELRAPAPVFSTETFFTGRTEGEGRLKIAFSRTKHVAVHGTGHVEPDGTLVLDQIVETQGKPATRRTWHIHRTAAGGYAGTLSDAAGPVTGEVAGNRLHLAFPMRGGFRAEQWLYLRPGGQVALNRLVVRKLGVTVAALTETIRRVP